MAAKLLHFVCLPLLGLAAWQTSRRFFPAASPWQAAALTVTIPTVLWEATTAYVDLALALYVALALYSLLRWREGGRPTWFCLAASCLGVAAATKHLALVALALAALALAIDPRRVPQEAAGKGGERFRSAAARLGAPALLVMVALLAASPWYIRAWQAAGNSFFPEFYDVLGGSPHLRWDEVNERRLDAFKSSFGVPRTPLHLALLPWTVTMHGSQFKGSAGPVFLVLLPVIAVAGLRDRGARWLAGITAGYLVIWASPLSSFQLRFLVPLALPLGVLAGRASSLVWRSGDGWPSRAAPAGIAMLLVLNLPPFLPLHEGDRNGWDGWLNHVPRVIPRWVVTGRQDAGQYLREHVPAYGAWQYLQRSAPADARVLVAGARHNFYATRDLLSIDAVAARPAWSSDPRQAAAGLAALGVTHVIIEHAWLRGLRAPLPALASETFRQAHLSLVYADPHVGLYRVGPHRAAEPASLTPAGS